VGTHGFAFNSYAALGSAFRLTLNAKAWRRIRQRAETLWRQQRRAWGAVSVRLRGCEGAPPIRLDPASDAIKRSSTQSDRCQHRARFRWPCVPLPIVIVLA
jgi:hypothetical protein